MQEEVIIGILKDVKVKNRVEYNPKMVYQTEFKALKEHNYLEVFVESDKLVVGLTAMGQYALSHLSQQ